MARQAISMAMKALNDGGEGDLAGELQQRVPGLSDVAGGGGLMGGIDGGCQRFVGWRRWQFTASGISRHDWSGQNGRRGPMSFLALLVNRPMMTLPAGCSLR